MKEYASPLTFQIERVLFMLVLIGIAAAAPLLKQQLITGSIVNACLIIAACTLGARDGMLVGLIPSAISLAVGLLPAALAPMIPFIIIGNTVLVLTVSFLNKRNYWFGMVSGALLKFGVIFGTSFIVTGLLNKNVAAIAANMMGWTQLVTVLIGGIIAFAVLNIFKRKLASLKN